ncbi:unnamed protein product [Rotaria sordida]|uniref:Uncharacterized protein n=2 Tax=Rotaria sordida TaxID=392033 RepID=A0A814V8T8_9BILA|nr:unnamed protein product [Rotaria sordida]CAF1396291.1 unnamed protein product [Rotaria sordida]CAF4032504.1 unnamed protein product [Rotaria sordida]CAF4068545.1 unnamed protein product [Rotaria sordida]CAF4086551.1 unnamed protein product [Rotaria sordida]
MQWNIKFEVILIIQKDEWLLAIESYSEAIKTTESKPTTDLPLYVLYSNRSASFIQNKNYYSGYEDAR